MMLGLLIYFCPTGRIGCRTIEAAIPLQSMSICGDLQRKGFTRLKEGRWVFRRNPSGGTVSAL
jgi:hypothetical protein